MNLGHRHLSTAGTGPGGPQTWGGRPLVVSPTEKPGLEQEGRNHVEALPVESSRGLLGFPTQKTAGQDVEGKIIQDLAVLGQGET